jgi:hypothetical protein
MTTSESKTTKPTLGREVTRADGVKVRPVIGKPSLEFFRSAGNRVLFIRLPDEDTNDDALVSLFRLLESQNIDTDRAMDKYKRIRAATVPAYLERKLKNYYNMVELSEEAWLEG